MEAQREDWEYRFKVGASFHTICTHLGIIGKRFQVGGLKNICIESGIIIEGSMSGVPERRKYNRTVRFHKLMYEALMRPAWSGFENWLRWLPKVFVIALNTGQELQKET